MPPRRLHISSTLSLPVDAVTATFVVYGGKGMGKTNLLSVILEEMSKAGMRWCSIDPIGVHWGLRHAADGKGDGVPVLILGGVHGHLPIEPTGGEVVADLVADEDVNVIIDCSRRSDGQMWSIGERTRFITAFALRLFQRQGSMIDGRRREPIFVALDEAARYIPQTIPSGSKDLPLSLGAWEQLVEEGRNVGIGVGLFTQRSARINKSVAELADMMLAFRTTGPNSIAAIIDWLGEHVPKADQRAMIEQVRKLPVGSCLTVSPGWLEYEGVVAIRARETFDSSATPKPGERVRRVTGSGATVDLEAYRVRMAETIERAEADNPRVLKARIRELERALASAPTEVQTVEVEKRVEVPVPTEVPVLTDVQVKEVRETYEGLVELAQSFTGMENAIVETANGVLTSLRTVLNWKVEQNQIASAPHTTGGYRAGAKTAAEMKPPPASVSRRGQRRPPLAPAPRSGPSSADRPPQTSAQGVDRTLAKAERQVLSCLATLNRTLSSTQISQLTGRSSKSSAFKNALSSLRTSGLITGGRDAISLTDAGLAAINSVDSYDLLPTPGPGLIEWWKSNHLGKAEKSIIDVLMKVYPATLTKEEISEESGYSLTSSGFKNSLSRMRSFALIEGYDDIRIAPMLMGDG